MFEVFPPSSSGALHLKQLQEKEDVSNKMISSNVEIHLLLHLPEHVAVLVGRHDGQVQKDTVQMPCEYAHYWQQYFMLKEITCTGREQ